MKWTKSKMSWSNTLSPCSEERKQAEFKPRLWTLTQRSLLCTKSHFFMTIFPCVAFMHSCIDVTMCGRMCFEHAHIHACVWTLQFDFGMFFDCCLLKQGLCLNLESANWASIARQLVLRMSCLYFPSFGSRDSFVLKPIFWSACFFLSLLPTEFSLLPPWLFVSEHVFFWLEISIGSSTKLITFFISKMLIFLKIVFFK